MPKPPKLLQRARLPLLNAAGRLTLPGLWHDLLAGVALATFIIPAGMGYAVASGLPPANGLYASIAALLGYALFGPSRRLILGPDSSLTALVAIAVATPPAEPSVLIARAAVLAILSGALCLLAGMIRAGFLTNLISLPVRLGYLNGLAVTLIVSQLSPLLGCTSSTEDHQGHSFLWEIQAIATAVTRGQMVSTAAAVGGGCLLVILALRRWLPAAPGVPVAVIGGAAGAWALQTVGWPIPELLEAVPTGLPVFQLPVVPWQDVGKLLPAAAAIAVVSAADTAVLSRALNDTVAGVPRPNQELAAVGLSNLFAGLMQGFPVSSSSTRTPVAMTAGSRSQLTGLVAAGCVGLLLIATPRVISTIPKAALAAVVIAAASTLLDLPGLARLARQRISEFAVSLVCIAGVIFIGVVPGIGLAVLLAVGAFVWQAWQPYSAVLGRLPGRKGYHDISRHPEAHQVPGLVLFRWDSPLFFANAEIFRSRLLAAVAAAEQHPRRIVVTAEPVTDIDVTAAEMLQELKAQLSDRGISFCFAELKGPVKDRLRRYGLYETFSDTGFYPTTGSAVRDYLHHERLDWNDPFQQPHQSHHTLTP